METKKIYQQQDSRTGTIKWHAYMNYNGRTYQKNFSSKKYGGIQKAKEIAQNWLKRVRSEIKAEEKGKKLNRSRLHIVEREVFQDGRRFVEQFYVVPTGDDKKKISITKLGEERALLEVQKIRNTATIH